MCTCFAYGQTGSGKTYTMFGQPGGFQRKNSFNDQQGLIPRSINYLFNKLRAGFSYSGSIFFIRVSYYELYNEQVKIKFIYYFRVFSCFICFYRLRI